jgi:hypothetical protein
LDGLTPAALAELERAITFVLATRNCSLKIEPTFCQGEKEWELQQQVHRRETNKRHSHYFSTLIGYLWKSKAQQLVTLFSAEAAFVALLKLKRNKVCGSNIGDIGNQSEAAIYHLSKNVSMASCTRHVDAHTTMCASLLKTGLSNDFLLDQKKTLLMGSQRISLGTYIMMIT